MDDYAREMMDLKTLVTRTLEKKGVLAKIRVIKLVKLKGNDFRVRPRGWKPPHHTSQGFKISSRKKEIGALII